MFKPGGCGGLPEPGKRKNVTLPNWNKDLEETPNNTPLLFFSLIFSLTVVTGLTGLTGLCVTGLAGVLLRCDRPQSADSAAPLQIPAPSPCC